MITRQIMRAIGSDECDTLIKQRFPWMARADRRRLAKLANKAGWNLRDKEAIKRIQVRCA